MRKNWKILGLLLFAVVLLFTMCKQKGTTVTTDTTIEEVTTDTAKSSNKTVNYVDLNMTISDYFPDLNFAAFMPLIAPSNFTFIQRVRSNNTYSDKTLKTFAIINDNTSTLYELTNNNTDKAIPINVVIIGDGSDNITTKIRFVTCKSPYDITVPANIIGDVTKTENVTAPDVTTTGNAYFQKVTVAGIDFWFRNKETDPNKDLKSIVKKKATSTAPEQVVTWPPTFY